MTDFENCLAELQPISVNRREGLIGFVAHMNGDFRLFVMVRLDHAIVELP
jgi:hypothetical protein